MGGSCLRRNDGEGAGMTEEGPREWWERGCGNGGRGAAGMAGERERRGRLGLHGRWWLLAASHPPPNLPPKRGEG